MLSDLTAPEVVALVQIISAAPEDVMVVNENDELTFLRNLPAVKTLGEKISQAGEREDVKQYIKEHFE